MSLIKPIVLDETVKEFNENLTDILNNITKAEQKAAEATNSATSAAQSESEAKRYRNEAAAIVTPDGLAGQVTKNADKIAEISDVLSEEKHSSNFFNKNDVTVGYVSYDTGIIHRDNVGFVYTFIPFKANTEFGLYEVSDAQICFFNGETYISGVMASGGKYVGITPNNCNKICVSLRASLLNGAQLNKGNEKLPYEPYSIELVFNDETLLKSEVIQKALQNVTFNKISVGVSSVHKTIRSAIESVKNPSENNRYIIEIAEGIYNLKNEYSDVWGDADFIGCTVPPFTTLVGVGNRDNVIIIAEDTTTAESKRLKMATLNLYQTSSLENLTVNGNGLKYTIHDDFQKDQNDVFINEYRTIKNVVVKGDNPLTSSIYGAGLQNGTRTHFIDCVFSSANKIALVYFHNATSLIKRSGHIIFENCRFKSYNTSFGDCRLYLSSVRSALNVLTNKVTLKGTKVRTIYHSYEDNGADVIRWNVDGYANQIENLSGGAPLTDYTSLIATEEYTRYSDGAY